MKQQNVVNMQIYKEKGEGTVLSMIWNVWHISVNWLVTSSTNIRMTWLDCLARMGVTREWMENWNWCSPSRIWTNLQVGLVHPCRLKSWHTGRVSSNCKYNNTFISIIVVTQFQYTHSPAASTLLASALWYKVSNYSKCNLGSFVIS